MKWQSVIIKSLAQCREHVGGAAGAVAGNQLMRVSYCGDERNQHYTMTCVGAVVFV